MVCCRRPSWWASLQSAQLHPGSSLLDSSDHLPNGDKNKCPWTQGQSSPADLGLKLCGALYVSALTRTSLSMQIAMRATDRWVEGLTLLTLSFLRVEVPPFVCWTSAKESSHHKVSQWVQHLLVCWKRP